MTEGGKGTFQSYDDISEFAVVRLFQEGTVAKLLYTSIQNCSEDSAELYKFEVTGGVLVHFTNVLCPLFCGFGGVCWALSC